MTDRLFIYAVDQGGGIYKLQIQQSADEVSAMIAESVITGNDKVLVTNNAGNITNIEFAQNEMLAKVGTASLEGVPPSSIRSLLNVEEDADRNRAANVGGGIEVFKNVTTPDPAFINLRTLIATSARRTKLTQNTNDIIIDAVITPTYYNLLGDAQIIVGAVYAIFKTEQAMTIDEFSAVITLPSPATTNEDLGFTILSNTTRDKIGATTHIDMTGANVLIDHKDDQTGIGRSTYNQTDTDTRILDPAIPADSWVMLDILSKTDPLRGFTINLFLENT